MFDVCRDPRREARHHSLFARFEEVTADGDLQTCGNDYDKAFTVTWTDGRSATFDSVECAAVELAPTCEHCECRILGHGVESGGAMFCCAHCARQAGNHDVSDRGAAG